jgi:pimeloyl-ACP methyl ester carboxylesterase
MTALTCRLARSGSRTPWGLGSRRLLILPLLAALLTAASLGRAQPSAARYERGACSFEGAASLAGKVECGSLLVLEDRARPDGRTVRLSVAVLKATGPSPKPDPVVYLSGGPGGRGIEGVEGWLARPFARDRDIVLVDQRGTGSSGPLCPDSAKEIVRLMAQDLSPADDIAQNVAVARRCLEDLRRRGVDPTAYASAATAVDLNTLRSALGYEQWNLLGISYGTRLALTAMRDDPQGIRSVVLDSTFPPAEDFYRNLSLSVGPALDRLGADCAAVPSCRQSVGDLRAEVTAFEAELAQHPLSLRIDDPEYVPGGTFVVNPQDLRFVIGEQLVFGSSRAVLPAFVHAWRMGNTESLAALFRITAQVLGGHDVGKYYAVQCFEEMPFSDAGLDASGVPAAFHDAARAVCADWKLPSADARENEPVRSPIPALLLAGELDPRAPAEFSRRAVARLEHGQLIEVPGAAHNTLGEGCVGDVVAVFLDDPSRRPDSSCLARRQALAPLGAVHVTSGPLTLLRATRRGELATLLWLGASLLVLLSAAVIWPLRGVWRWRRGKRATAGQMPRGSVRSRRLKMAAHASLGLGALVAWVLVLALVRASLRLFSGQYALAIVLGLPDVAALFVLPKVVLLTTLGSLVAAVLAWRQPAWSRFERWHYLLTLGAAVAMLAFLVRYQLF